MTLSGSARLAGIVGWPVNQSLSPRLHAFWLREYGVDGAYVPLAVCREELSTALRGLRAAGFVGVNVTIPHKQAAFAVAEKCDGPARAAAAANLLLFRTDHIEARNTDAEGLAESLTESLGANALAGRSVAILGAGGAARAAVIACERLSASNINLLNRTFRRAQQLVADMRGSVAAALDACEMDDWPALAANTFLLINATSAGVTGMSLPDIVLDQLPDCAVVCDLVYRPLETQLLRRARSLGLRTVDGLGMLIHQAVPAFEALYGMRPKVSAPLRAHLEQALRDDG